MGGRMTLDDLANYRAVEREPVRGTYRGHEIVSMPPPSSGGAHIVEILNILEGFPIHDEGLNSAAEIHDMAEAEKLAYADRAHWLGDPDFIKIPLKGLTSKAYADALRASIPPDRARPAKEIMPGDPQRYESDQTTHFTIVDAAGDAVSNTYTLNTPFGSGIVAEGTGVLLNNELDDFAAKPGAANVYRPARRRRQRAGAEQASALLDEPDVGLQGRPTRTRDRLARRLAHHHDRAADPRRRHRPRPQCRRGDRRAARPRSGLSRPVADRARHLARYDPAPEGHGLRCRRWAKSMGSTNTIARAPDGVLTGASDPRQRGTLAVGY